MAKPQPRFFAGFKPLSFVVKATLGYIALLASGNELADYSVLVSDLRDDIKSGNAIVFKLYLLCLVVLLGSQLARLKVRYDLAVLRAERKKGGQRRGTRR